MNDDVSLVVERWLDSGSCSSVTFECGSIIVWQVWKNRCRWVFEGIPNSAEVTRNMVNSAI